MTTKSFNRKNENKGQGNILEHRVDEVTDYWEKIKLRWKINPGCLALVTRDISER